MPPVPVVSGVQFWFGPDPIAAFPRVLHIGMLVPPVPATEVQLTPGCAFVTVLHEGKVVPPVPPVPDV